MNIVKQPRAIDQLSVPRSLPAPRLGSGHFIMAAVLLSLGYFLIWPVILLLINSFNTAADWFVEPRAGVYAIGRTHSSDRGCFGPWVTLYLSGQ